MVLLHGIISFVVLSEETEIPQWQGPDFSQN